MGKNKGFKDLIKNKAEEVIEEVVIEKQVSDVETWGGDSFKLLSKISSKREGWMKSTEAMQIDGLGCIVQVTTQRGGTITEDIEFVPGVRIKEEKNEDRVVTSRKLLKL
jgi:hypothetical protein